MTTSWNAVADELNAYGACGEFTSGTIHIFLAAGMDAFSYATKSV
jgi:hypothetical protein